MTKKYFIIIYSWQVPWSINFTQQKKTNQYILIKLISLYLSLFPLNYKQYISLRLCNYHKNYIYINYYLFHRINYIKTKSFIYIKEKNIKPN